jgi:cyclic-di-AMP phosphodiesterase PgpH
MPLISFKNVRLFKASTPPAKRPGSREDEAGRRRRFYENPAFLILVFGAGLAALTSTSPIRPLPDLREGQVAPSDLVSPADIQVEDNETTDQRRRAAEAGILPVYGFDPNVFLDAEDKVRRLFTLGRETAPAGRVDFAGLQKMVYDRFGIELGTADLEALNKAGFGSDMETALVNILEKYSARGVLLSKSLFNEREPERGLAVLRGRDGEKTVRVQDVLDVREAKSLIVLDVNALELTPRKKGLLISLAYGFLAPNITFNKVETQARKANARARVEPVYFTVAKGRTIIRKGEEATADTVKRIAAINSVLRPARAWPAAIGAFCLFSLLLTALWFYLLSLLPFRSAWKYFLMAGLTLSLSLLLDRLGASLAGAASLNARFFLFQSAESAAFAIPFQFGVLLFAFLTTNAVALMFAVLNALLAGYLLGANLLLAIYGLVGGIAAIYGIKYYRKVKRTSALKAGLFVVAPVNMLMGLIIFLLEGRPGGLETLASNVFMAILGGMLGAGLAFVLLPIYENVFRVLTQSKLLELTNSESPLFRQLALQAPGSYHHSLVVSQLAEKAAEEIGVDPLLVKAGALYHDIGKIKMPEYFIENKDKKFDAHKDLTPSMSTLVIVNHVKEGAELARKERLPAEIREIVEQHHGTSLVRYFYLKAKEKYDPDMHKIGEETYRYPGPSPQTKEAGLVMLADSVEAASRSLKSQKEDSLKRVVRDIFDNYLQDGQLDDCGFSLRELRVVASSFLATLKTVYQPRVEYPGFDFEPKKKKKTEPGPRNGNGGWTNGHDRDSQPPETPKD